MKHPSELACARLDYAYRKLVKSRLIYIGDTGSRGLGIFAAARFKEGSVIVADEDGDYFDGAVSEAEVRELGLDLSIHCFQIGHDRYLLPHGSIDDLINHSCNPTAGIRLVERGYHLIALHDVAPGDELTYDYSTYIANPRERLRCACGSPACRGDVGPFRELPPALRAYYLERGVVGAFAATPLREPAWIWAGERKAG